uniref:Mediator of RNA polymerase II transcription subunit 17 n=1 Tax=Syphacia muris TaxID=451379 RepID=A0A0N5AFA6_9BILA
MYGSNEPSTSRSYGTPMYVASPVQRSSRRTGVDIALESGLEWRVFKIENSGQEIYFRPPDYSERVAKLARRVDWRKLVGADATFDNPGMCERNLDEDEYSDTESVVPAELGIEDRQPPDAGPWHTVARNLFEALQQINLLTDTLKVLKLPYLEALTVADTFEMQHNMQEVVQHSKHFQWVTKRKALSEAANVLEQSQKSRSKVSAAKTEKEMFFEELKKVRENWRVRKTGDFVYGDIGYSIFGNKYDPKEMFDILRRPRYSVKDEQESSNQSCLQVRIPADLVRRSTLAVSIESDDINANKDLFAPPENDLDYARIDLEKAKEIHWEKALQWGQETLICRDIFRKLCNDAVILKGRLAVVRENVLIVSLFDDLLLRIELRNYVFEDGELPVVGDLYLNRSLRQLFVLDQCTRWLRHQSFVTMPLTQLHESLDLRGPDAMPKNEVESRLGKRKDLLVRFIDLASHYVLQDRAALALEQFILRVNDPQVTWKWLRSTPFQSSIVLTAVNRNYDHPGKFTFYIRIDADSFYIITKEGQRMNCWRDENMLINTVEVLICNFMLNSVAHVATKLWQWQILHANLNAIDGEANPRPTLYMCNQSATRSLFIEFRPKDVPIIRVRKCKPEKLERIESPEEFIKLNFSRLIGSSLCRKIDNLCSMLDN